MTIQRTRKKKSSKVDSLETKNLSLTQHSGESSLDSSSEAHSAMTEGIDCLEFVKPIDFTEVIEDCICPLKEALGYCEPCQCKFFLVDDPRTEETALADAQEAYECSSEASSAFVSIIELDDEECMKMVNAVKVREKRNPNTLALPFKDEYLTVKFNKEKQNSAESDSLQSSGIHTKEDADNRYARPGWITGLHDPIGLGAYEWEKLVKSIIGQGRYGRNSSREPFFRFELPINLEYLTDSSPLIYLENYCKVSDRRMALYQKEFIKHKEQKGSFITKSNLYKALNSIMVGTLTNIQFGYICEILEITGDNKISIKSFFGICAVTERLFFSKNLTSSSEESYEIQKGYIETADFMNLAWKLKTVKVPENVDRLIRAL